MRMRCSDQTEYFIYGSYKMTEKQQLSTLLKLIYLFIYFINKPFLVHDNSMYRTLLFFGKYPQ
jgi:hypothetical protein